MTHSIHSLRGFKNLLGIFNKYLMQKTHRHFIIQMGFEIEYKTVRFMLGYYTDCC